jgi:hypothetical protein
MMRQVWWLAQAAAFCAILAPACQWSGWSADTSSGLTSMIRVQGGQAKRGSIADPPETSAATATLFPKNATIFAGVSNKSIKGIIGPDANTVALGIAGDVGYWEVPALNPESSSPGSYNFTAGLSISPEVSRSRLVVSDTDGNPTLPLSIRAIDNSGNFGPATIQTLYLYAPPFTGSLAVTLEWDSATDLDLHVLAPATGDAGPVEVWTKHRSADVEQTDAGALADGTLDFDSNADCQIDGRDRENVFWNGAAPTGHYVVRVAAASLCGLTSAAWHAYAEAAGVIVGEASGVLTEAATRSSAGEGSGVTAFEFYYP